VTTSIDESATIPPLVVLSGEIEELAVADSSVTDVAGISAPRDAVSVASTASSQTDDEILQVTYSTYSNGDKIVTDAEGAHSKSAPVLEPFPAGSPPQQEDVAIDVRVDHEDDGDDWETVGIKARGTRKKGLDRTSIGSKRGSFSNHGSEAHGNAVKKSKGGRLTTSRRKHLGRSQRTSFPLS
jgi:hypothetical protein